MDVQKLTIMREIANNS